MESSKMNIARTTAIGTALGALAFAGVAQAESRSAAAMPAYTPVSAAQTVARGSAAAEGESDIASGPGIVLAILALLAMIAAIAIAAGGGGFDSPG